jgi:hypothetical protein
MKGKNLGRTITGRGRKKKGQVKGVGEISESKDNEKHVWNVKGDTLVPVYGTMLPVAVAAWLESFSLPINPFAGTEMSYFSLPELAPKLRCLFYQCKR